MQVSGDLITEQTNFGIIPVIGARRRERLDEAIAAIARPLDAAALASKTLAKAPDNDTLLALYSLYKQASVGDVAGERPGALDLVNRAKFDAWSQRRGMTREAAMTEYVALVAKLKAAEGA